MRPARVRTNLTSGRTRRVVENDDFGRFVRRIVAAHGRRVAGGDIEALGDLAALSAEVDAALLVAVAGLRRSGWSWAEIGSRLGITRQSAHERFGAAVTAVS